jgi:excisionase family DNA binding protein
MVGMSTRPTSSSQLTLESFECQTVTVEEAAAILGISRSTAYECVRDGSIPSLRFRRRVVVTRSTLAILLQPSTVTSSADIDESIVR